MNQTRLVSSSRLLRGVTFLEKQNEIQMSIVVDKRHSMRLEMDRLLKLLGEKNYADTRLLLPWGRRVAKLSRDIKMNDGRAAKALPEGTEPLSLNGALERKNSRI